MRNYMNVFWSGWWKLLQLTSACYGAAPVRSLLQDSVMRRDGIGSVSLRESVLFCFAIKFHLWSNCVIVFCCRLDGNSALFDYVEFISYTFHTQCLGIFYILYSVTARAGRYDDMITILWCHRIYFLIWCLFVLFFLYVIVKMVCFSFFFRRKRSRTKLFRTLFRSRLLVSKTFLAVLVRRTWIVEEGFGRARVAMTSRAASRLKLASSSEYCLIPCVSTITKTWRDWF